MPDTLIIGRDVARRGVPRARARRYTLSGISSKLPETAARALGRAFPGRLAPMLHDPVFFIGSGRSGTNLLAGLLDAHPELSVFPDEANDLWHPRLYPWARSKLDVPPTWADGRAFARVSLSSRTPADDERLRAVFGAYQRLTGGRYFVNKSILITFILDHVLEVFSDARFIHLLRDGRSVALSFAQKEIKKILKDRDRYARHGLELPLEKLIVRFAENWQDQMREIDSHRERLSGRLFEIRYEDLCADPERELGKLARLLAIDPHGFTTTGVPISSQDYKFARDVPAAVQDQVTALLSPTLREKGYLPTPIGV
jgi:Sulfotransferase family